MAKLEPVPGTNDIWSPETERWVFLENTARKVMALYAYTELRTPIIERTDVFVRGIGNETEVVQKEMYTFADRGGRSLTLRPEGTAGVMRAIANQGVGPGEEKRVFYSGPMFRGERPAAGRKRQFHQVGVEAVGKTSPVIDAESIAMLVHYLEEIGLPDHRLLVNSRGTKNDRQQASAVLQDFFRSRREEMCEDCKRRLDTNVWRILDCKMDSCRPHIDQAPPILELLSEESRNFFQEVQKNLKASGIDYELAPHLVRGLDYYQHTVFEVVIDDHNLGAQNAVAGGGRYEIELPGSRKPIPGVGFALGLERLLMAMGDKPSGGSGIGPVDVFVAALGETCLPAALELSSNLRHRNLRVLCESEGRSMKAQMRNADKSGAPIALIVGEQELRENKVTVKYMHESRQETLTREEAAKAVNTALQKS